MAPAKPRVVLVPPVPYQSWYAPGGTSTGRVEPGFRSAHWVGGKVTEMQNASTEFLAPGARLGTWWVPEGDDLNDEGDLDRLPPRREPGVLAPSTTRGWRLFVARPLGAGVSGFDPLPGRGRRDLMWGKVPGSAVSLFDAVRASQSTEFYSHSHSVWRGEWCVESPGTWVDASSKVEGVDINFAAASAWSERTPGEGLDIDLQRQWDNTLTTFTRPEPVVYRAAVGGATVQLRRETGFECSSEELDLRLSTCFSIDDDVELGDVRDKWVVPLHDFVGFFWLQNPGVVWIRVRLADSRWPAETYYAGKLARVGEDYKALTSKQLAQFATLQGIWARGYSFKDLVCGYWRWRDQGYGRALELLSESQDPEVDQSLDARLLNAVKSLESYARTLTNTSGTVNLADELQLLLDGAGRVGDDVRDLWQARGGQPFGNALARLRHNYLAHEQSGTTDTPRSPDELADQHWHLVALQWLLRRTYLQEMGLDGGDASDLVTNAMGYKQDCREMRDHYRRFATPAP